MPYKNKEDRNARRRLRYATDLNYKKYLNDDNKKRWAALPHEERSRRSRRNYQELKTKVLAKFGNKCNNPNCRWMNEDGSVGCTDSRCLQIDHVFGGGYKELARPDGLGRIVTTNYLKKVLADSEGLYQLLCSNCNWIKRVINKEVRKYPEKIA